MKLRLPRPRRVRKEPTAADDLLDRTPVRGFTRSGYMILYEGTIYIDAGTAAKAHAIMCCFRRRDALDE